MLTLEGQTVAADIALVGRSGARSGRAGSIGDAVFRTLTFLFALLVLLILTESARQWWLYTVRGKEPVLNEAPMQVSRLTA